MAQLEPAHWVERHADALYRVALLQLKEQALAEDIVQEAFMAGLLAINTFREQAKERTWLMAILRNKINDYFRGQSRRPTLRLDDVFYNQYFDHDATGDFDHWLPDKTPGDWGNYDEPDESEALNAVLYECLAKLPPRYAQVITLKFINDATPTEICQEVGISASNYWTLLHRIKILLRECLEKNWYSVQ